MMKRFQIVPGLVLSLFLISGVFAAADSPLEVSAAERTPPSESAPAEAGCSGCGAPTILSPDAGYIDFGDGCLYVPSRQFLDLDSEGILKDGSGHFVPLAGVAAPALETLLDQSVPEAGKYAPTLTYTTINDAGERPVVIELFTATWCPYCYGAGTALDKITKELTSRRNVLVVAYHIWTDGFDTTYGSSRASSYGVSAIPTLWINGLTMTNVNCTQYSGQASLDNVIETYISLINQKIVQNATNQPFRCMLSGTLGRFSSSLKLHIETDTGYVRPIRARFFITEDNIPVTASNGQTELNSVFRAYLPEKIVDLTQPGQLDFQIDSGNYIPCLDPANLKPVVILQDTNTREILGAVGTFQPPPTPSPSPTPEPLGASAWEYYE